MKFNLDQNYSIEMNKNWQAYNYFRKEFSEVINQVDKTTEEMLELGASGKISLEDLLYAVQEKASEDFDLISEYIVRVLYVANIKNYSKEKIFNEYYYKYINFDSYLDPIFEAVAKIYENEQILEQIRQHEKDIKGSWIGGGFGFVNAIKGSLQADVMNFVSKSFHNMFMDPITKLSNSTKIEQQKLSLMKSSSFKNQIKEAFHNSAVGFFMVLIELLLEHRIISNLEFCDILLQHDEDIRNEFDNTINYSDLSNKSEIKKFCCECIRKSPYNIIYYFTLKVLDPFNEDIDLLMKEVGIYDEYDKETKALAINKINQLSCKGKSRSLEELIERFDEVLRLSKAGVNIRTIIVPFINEIPLVINNDSDANKLIKHIKETFDVKYHREIIHEIEQKSRVAYTNNIDFLKGHQEGNYLWDDERFYNDFDRLVKLARDNNSAAQYEIIHRYFDHRFLCFADDLAKAFGKMQSSDDMPEIEYLSKNVLGIMIAKYFPDYRNNGFDLLMLTLYLQMKEHEYVNDSIKKLSENGNLYDCTFNLLSKSLSLGCNASAYYLGLFCYAKGNVKDGMNYMKIAADNSFFLANKFIGQGYKKGQYGFPQDDVKGKLYDPKGLSVMYNILASNFKNIIYKTYMHLCTKEIEKRGVSGEVALDAYVQMFDEIVFFHKFSGFITIEKDVPSSINLSAGECVICRVRNYETEESILTITNKNIYYLETGLFKPKVKSINLKDIDFSSICFDKDRKNLNLFTFDKKQKAVLRGYKDDLYLIKLLLERVSYDLNKSAIGDVIKSAVSSI